MSRNIDTSKTLSEDDKLYLAQRAQLDTSVLSVQEQQKLLSPESRTLEDIANTGTVNTANLTVEELEAELKLRREQAEKERVKHESEEDSDEDDDDEEEDDEPLEPPYMDATKAAITREILRRNADRDDDEKISLVGNKEALAAALDEDDEE